MPTWSGKDSSPSGLSSRAPATSWVRAEADRPNSLSPSFWSCRKESIVVGSGVLVGKPDLDVVVVMVVAVVVVLVEIGLVRLVAHNFTISSAE